MLLFSGNDFADSPYLKKMYRRNLLKCLDILFQQFLHVSEFCKLKTSNASYVLESLNIVECIIPFQFCSWYSKTKIQADASKPGVQDTGEWTLSRKKTYGVSPGIQDSFHVKMVCDRVEVPFISWNWKIYGMLGRILSYFTILAFNPHLLIVVTL